MGGLASAPGIRNIGDPIGLSTPGMLLFVDNSGDVQGDVSNLFYDNTRHDLTVHGVLLGLGALSTTDVSLTTLGRSAGGAGGAAPASGINNTAIGSGALQSVNATGINNTAIGWRAGRSNVTHLRNVFIGAQAGENVSGGDDNIAIGYQAMQGTSGGNAQNNVAIGTQAMQALSNGISSTGNIAIGRLSGTAITSGANNTLIGGGAGSGITTGANCIAIGSSTMSTGNFVSSIAIGQNAQVSGNSAIAIGTSSLTPVPDNSIEIGIAGIHTTTTLHGNVTNSGNLLFGTDNTFDIGQTGAQRPRNAFVAGRLQVESNGNLQFINQVTGAGAAVGTLNNAPAAGDPAFWLQIAINGTNRFIPCW